MNFFGFKFTSNQKYRNFSRPIAAKSGRKKPPQKTVQKSLSQSKIIKKTTQCRRKDFFIQYHSINIEKLPKGIKMTFQTLHSKLDRALESNAFESSYSDESDIGLKHITFLEKHFSAKVY